MVYLLMVLFCIGAAANMLRFPYSLLGNFIMLVSFVAIAALDNRNRKVAKK